MATNPPLTYLIDEHHRITGQTYHSLSQSIKRVAGSTTGPAVILSLTVKLPATKLDRTEAADPDEVAPCYVQ